MLAEILIIVIPAVIVLVVLLVAGYFIMRFMRGSIKITLPKNSFDEGQQITGSFELTTRKEIEGNRLYVALVGKEVMRESRGDRTTTHTREIYRNEQTMEEAKTYPQCQTVNYDFQLTAPSSTGPDFLDSPLGKTLKVGMELLGGRRTHLQWAVEARLDAKGIDLISSKKVTINMSKIT